MNQKEKDIFYMSKALAEAKTAFEKDEVPVGAVIVSNDKIIARAHNLTEMLNDVTAHAEMQAITSAANYLGVTEAACTGSTSTVNFTDDTVEIGAANDLIKPGQFVLLVNDADSIDAGLTVDAETPTPVYEGPNKAGVQVVSVNDDNVTLSAALTPTASQTLVFIDEFHGAGGTTAEGIVFPKGLTIYGRWTKVTPEADADGGVICYFGK